jgi:DNA-binding MarR family transcriptional regulator
MDGMMEDADAIRELSEQVSAIQSRMDDLSRPDAAVHVRRMYQSRRARDSVFGTHAGLFGEPAWDILLDLYDYRERRQQISVGSACLASGVPHTTALRTINCLVEHGLIDKLPDRLDRRRSNLELTQEGVDLIERWADLSVEKLIGKH